MLSIKQRQEKLKYLGYYKGKIDGKVGRLTKSAYKKLQNDYFFRAKDKDGIYGKNTDILLNCVYNVKYYTTNFDIKKDKLYCRCKGKYCTGYPAIMNVNMLKNLQGIRDKYGATTVTSMLRCSKWNKLQGGSTFSRHKSGKAVDFRNSKCNTLNGRKEEIDYWMTFDKSRYSYCNGYYRNGSKKGTKKASSMGTSIHGDVK